MNNTDNIASMMHLTNELELQCPYVDASDVCNASLSSLLPSPTVRVNFCNSEDYDNCPIFLAKVLSKEAEMTCLDYVSEDFRCLRGIPVTPRFSGLFCKGKYERCPLIIWEKSQTKNPEMLRPKSFINIWRRSMSL